MELNLGKVKVGDVMSRSVLTIPAEAMAIEAAKKMEALNAGAIVVTDGDGRVVGIFSERDLLTKVTAHDKDPAKTPMSEVMTPNPESLRSGTPVSEAFVVTQKGHFRHIPIIDNGVLVGIVSVRDIYKVLFDILGKMLFE